jgi:hypothetical protein
VLLFVQSDGGMDSFGLSDCGTGLGPQGVSTSGVLTSGCVSVLSGGVAVREMLMAISSSVGTYGISSFGEVGLIRRGLSAAGDDPAGDAALAELCDSAGGLDPDLADLADDVDDEPELALFPVTCDCHEVDILMSPSSAPR